MTGSDEILHLSGIAKTFGEKVALRDVALSVRRGEVHVIMGENGAGKSTLMNILAGIHQPSAGVIQLDGRKVEIRSPGAARRLGIGMVHQHFMLVETMTVAENIMLGWRAAGPLARADVRPWRARHCWHQRATASVSIRDALVGRSARSDSASASRSSRRSPATAPTCWCWTSRPPMLTPAGSRSELLSVIDAAALHAAGRSIIFITAQASRGEGGAADG